MATETFDPTRLIVSIEGATAIYRDEVAAAIARLEHAGIQEAEDLVATAGEDERGFGLRERSAFLNTLYQRADEFLLDDEGGYYRMIVHLTAYERSAAALEIWFHVASPGSEAGGIWMRHMVVGIDEKHVYADMGMPVVR